MVRVITAGVVDILFGLVGVEYVQAGARRMLGKTATARTRKARLY
jgi:hypothetical protein